jgi:hypothetical protein
MASRSSEIRRSDPLPQNQPRLIHIFFGTPSQHDNLLEKQIVNQDQDQSRFNKIV